MVNWKIPKISIREKLIPKIPELKEYVGKPYDNYVSAMKEYEKIMSEFELSKNKIRPKLSITTVSIIKTSIIALSIIISAFIIAYSYYEANRYVSTPYGFIIDKYNGTATKLNLQQ